MSDIAVLVELPVFLSDMLLSIDIAWELPPIVKPSHFHAIVINHA